MGFSVIENTNYELVFIAGDDEYIRMNVKDETGNFIPVDTDVTVKMGIKEFISSTEFIIPEEIATTYIYDADSQPYTIEFAYSSADTISILGYNGKKRSYLDCVYDIELHNTHLGQNDITTILSGNLKVRRSIAGAV